MTRPELRPLTSIRGLFAWVVVLYHIRLACLGWLPIEVVHVLAKGYLAVDFFFLLSGFVIWLNYGERLRGRGAAADFLVRRFARVWPLHAVMLGFGAAIALLLLATGRVSDHFPFRLLPLYLALMQDWGWSNALLWNDPAWSISGEWAAYLLTPLAVLALPRRRWPTPALLAAAAAPLLALFALLSWGHGGLGFSISEFGLPRCLAEFSCGTMLSELWRRWRGDARIEAGCWVTGLAMLAAWGAGMPEALALPFAFAALLLALALGAERARHPLAGRVVHWLGEVSYATYLSHFLLFFAFKLAFVRDAFDVPPALIAAYLLLVLLASAVLYHGIERPTQRLILAVWKRRHAGSPAATVPSPSTAGG
jgi:peptidoglycan/LPS O-acetylase OafA/YrhL